MKRILALVIALVCLSALCVPALAAGDTVTVHAQVPLSWGDPCCWAWKTPENTNAFGAWPGEAMTLDGDWYTIEVPNWINAVIINGNGGSVQTLDLPVTPGVDLWVVVADDGNGVVYGEEPGPDSKPMVPDASGSGGSSEPLDLMVAYVAGEEGLCGVAWDPAAGANAMSLISDTVFEITFKDVAAGVYQMKVTNGTWDQNWGGDGPDGNYIVKVAEGGDVTVQFDTATATISVSGAGAPGTAADLENAPAQPGATGELTDAYVAGVGALCGAEWDCAAADNKMTEVSDGVFEITYKNVAAGSYEFKVTNGTWDQSWGKDGGADNYVLEVASAGDVTISFDSSTNTITTNVGAASAPEATEPEATEPEATEPEATEGTEAPEATEGTKAPEATDPIETTESAEYKAAVRTRTILIIVLVFLGIVAVATVISIVPKKTAD